jgi:hypothetical protein
VARAVAEGRLQGTPPGRLRIEGEGAVQALPPALQAVIAVERGPARLTRLGQALAVAHLAFWVLLALLGEALAFDPVPSIGWVTVALVPVLLFHPLLQRVVPGARTRLPEVLGSMAPTEALEGLVAEPADPLLRAMAAQPWLLWSPPARSLNLELPRAVLARAGERLGAVEGRLQALEAELRAGEQLLGELSELGAEPEDDEDGPSTRAGAAQSTLFKRRKRSKHLRKIARALQGELRRADAPLRDAVEQAEPPDKMPGALRLAADLGPLLQRVESVVAEVDRMERETTSSSRSSRP